MAFHPTLYGEDYYAWVQAQAALLDARQFDALDLPHLIEEVLSLRRSELRALRNHLLRLLEHLLKLHVAVQHLPSVHQRARRSWRLTVQRQCLEVAEVLQDNPSLRPLLAEVITRAYLPACLETLKKLMTEEALVPSTCPWTPEQVIEHDFWPEEHTTP